MKRELIAQVGADGVLTVPLGEADANAVVRVVVEAVGQPTALAHPATNREEWLRFVESKAGKWQGELERPDQGEYEQRDWEP